MIFVYCTELDFSMSQQSEMKMTCFVSLAVFLPDIFSNIIILSINNIFTLKVNA